MISFKSLLKNKLINFLTITFPKLWNFRLFSSKYVDESLSPITMSASPFKINFSNSKLNIYNQIRALDGFSGAYCNFQGKRLKIWKSMITDNHFSDKLDGEITKIYKNGIGVKVSDGEIILLEVQPEGKKRMDALSFANGVDLLGKVLA